jgi:ABC-type sugar transport system substrate-binding protein
MKVKETRFLYLSAILVLILLTAAACPVSAHHKEYRIALFTPWEKGDLFWGQVADFMKAATDDLGMKLEVYYAHGTRRKMEEQVQEASAGESPPDALVILSFRKSGPELLQIAEENKIPVFLINAGVDIEKLKGPRVVLKHWIGEMLPDDESAGFDLANVLIDEALKAGKAGKDGKVDIVALGGTYRFAGPAVHRENGLLRALKLRDDARLKRIVPAHWKRSIAREKFLQLHKIYPEVSVYWAANDQIALGVMDASAELGLDIISGGVDWTSKALELIEAGRLTVSLGGHFMEGGWAAVLLYDWFHGRDFAEETVAFRSRMGLLTKDTVGHYKRSFQGKDGWDKIDFRKFSKVLNPEVGSYAFGFETVLEQIKGNHH